VKHPLLNQFNEWLQQIEQTGSVIDATRLNEWNSLMDQFQTHPEQLSSNHAQWIKTLAQNSKAMAGVVETLQDQATDSSEQLKKLREELHQFNVQLLLQQASLPQQLAPLIFTHTRLSTLFSEEQQAKFEQFKSTLNTPQFERIQQLVEAFVQWQQAGQTLTEEMNQLTDVATQQWQEQFDDSISAKEQIDLWGKIYDATYQTRFQEPSMQLAQSGWLNRWADLKLAWKQLLTQLTEQAGLPSPEQLDRLIEQLDQQRRRIRQLEKRLAALESSGQNNG